VTTCHPETRTRTYQVCEMQSEEQEYTYNVTVCHPETRTRTFKVCKLVPEEKSETYKVCVPVCVEKEIQVQVCCMVPKTITVQVPCGNTYASASACDSCRRGRRCR